MSCTDGSDRAQEPVELGAMEPGLKQALGDFKAHVHAWSEAAYAQPRQVRSVSAVKRSLALGWGLAVVLLAGATSGGVYVHHEQVKAAQVAAARAAEQRQEAIARAQKRAQEEEEMLASIDRAVSREVPSAMEPLAQLSEESEAR